MTRWLRSGLWAVPVAFALLFAGVGGYAYRALERSTRADLERELRTILDADVAALGLWMDMQKAVVRATAQDPRLLGPVRELLAIHAASTGDAAPLLENAARVELRQLLNPIIREHGYDGFALLEPGGRVLAAHLGDLVGRRLSVDAGRFDAVLAGGTTLSRPIRPARPVGSQGAEAAAVLRSAAAVPGEDGRTIALFGFSMRAADDFSDILGIASMGDSGETYAFDADGMMLSRSRFEEQLVAIGLLPEGTTSIHNIQIRDPGGSLVEGFVPEHSVRARPLTRMAAAAVDGEPGVDIRGYADYRGVEVIGAWTWLPELGMGIATEIDSAEAFAGLSVLRRTFTVLALALAAAAIGMFLYTVVVGRLQNRVDKARKLGRYQILEKIGEGGMGKVYRARHALLRRPTAVKLLEPQSASVEAVTRFEREVQAASSLTHPNTISIFDFGHTPDGAFYYAMEFLDGITIGDLVVADGAQPEARVVHLMAQACGSLAEAHDTGMIHRDLKPSNIMLCTRGGMRDFVKVLDFGLVRSEVRDDELALTKTTSLTGTPLYLSPEALESPDSMGVGSDVYQLGAIAYFLLCGRHVFSGETLVEVLSQHLHTDPTPPSEVLGAEVSPDLERLILSCLKKDPAERPPNAGALRDALEACDIRGSWSRGDARAWWDAWGLRRQDQGAEDGESTGSLPSGWQVELGGRSGTFS